MQSHKCAILLHEEPFYRTCSGIGALLFILIGADESRLDENFTLTNSESEPDGETVMHYGNPPTLTSSQRGGAATGLQ
jgi:hypothetical protein